MTQNELNATNPAPASAGADSAQAPRLSQILLPLIAADGQVEKRLQAVRTQTLKPRAVQIWMELSRDLETMRSAPVYASQYFGMSGQGDIEVICRRMLLWDGNGYTIDPVLKYALLCRVGLPPRDRDLQDRALERYQQAAKEYDLILGDLIPEDIRREGHVAYASYLYDQGINDTALDDWPEYQKRRALRSQRPLQGLATGLPSLDATLRGLRGAVFLGGGPGVGKSSLALSLAVGALRSHENLSVLYYSLEMPRQTLYDRLVCSEAGLDYLTVTAQSISAEVQTVLTEAEGRLRSAILPRLRIKENLTMSSSDKSLATILADEIVALQEATGTNTVLLVLDYFQLLPTPDTESQTLDKDNYRVEAIQLLLKWSSSRVFPMGQPILVISELRKGDAARGDSGISDLFGSGRLGYSAEAVMILEPLEGDSDGGVPVQLLIVKGRDGVTRGRIPLVFEHTRYRFREGAPGKKEPAAKPKATKTRAKGLDPLGGKESPN